MCIDTFQSAVTHEACTPTICVFTSTEIAKDGTRSNSGFLTSHGHRTAQSQQSPQDNIVDAPLWSGGSMDNNTQSESKTQRPELCLL